MMPTERNIPKIELKVVGFIHDLDRRMDKKSKRRASSNLKFSSTNITCAPKTASKQTNPVIADSKAKSGLTIIGFIQTTELARRSPQKRVAINDCNNYILIPNTEKHWKLLGGAYRSSYIYADLSPLLKHSDWQPFFKCCLPGQYYNNNFSLLYGPSKDVESASVTGIMTVGASELLPAAPDIKKPKIKTSPLVQPNKCRTLQKQVKSRLYRKKIDGYSFRTKRKVYRQAYGHCAYCGKHVSHTNATLDHILPFSKGGRYHLENLRLSCQACNNLKGNLTMEQFRGLYDSRHLFYFERKPSAPFILTISQQTHLTACVPIDLWKDSTVQNILHK